MYGYQEKVMTSTSTKIDLSAQVLEPLKVFFVKIVSFIPNIIEAAWIGLIGFLLAFLAMHLVRRFLDTIRFNQIAETTGVAEVLDEKKIGMTPSMWVSKLFYWIGIFITCIIALDVLHLRIPSLMLDETGFFTSMILTGLLIFLLGLFLSMIASKFVETTSRTLKAGNPVVQAGIIRWAIILMTFAIVMGRFGFPKDLIFISLAVIGATLCIAFVIAFGIGGIQWVPKVLDKFLK